MSTWILATVCIVFYTKNKHRERELTEEKIRFYVPSSTDFNNEPQKLTNHVIAVSGATICGCAGSKLATKHKMGIYFRFTHGALRTHCTQCLLQHTKMLEANRCGCGASSHEKAQSCFLPCP